MSYAVELGYNKDLVIAEFSRCKNILAITNFQIPHNETDEIK